GTNNEFGFDYLRDNMSIFREHVVQRGHHYAIVDEVDSVLIDEARTPLIISGPVDRSTHRYDKIKPVVEALVQKQNFLINKLLSDLEARIKNNETDPEIGVQILQAKKGAPKSKRLMKLLQEARFVRMMERTEGEYMRDKRMPELEAELYFVVDEKGHNIDLTEKGRQAISPENPDMFVLLDVVDEVAKAEARTDLSPVEKEQQKEEARRKCEIRAEEVHNISQLLRAYMLFEQDVEYIIQENKVIIVDEFTGRLMPGRRWSDGLHQAVEAKEGVSIEKETQTLATITLQNYFRLYDKLAGMTGTAETEAQEFVHTYGMDVVVIPTNRPIRRIDTPDRIFRNKREKYKAIVAEIQRLHDLGLPILVGTVSVDVSELLSRMLKAAKLSHNVLNAKNHAREAEIVRDAGKSGTITIATNMAGRGTDIKLGEGVVKCKRCCIRCDLNCEETEPCRGVKRREDYANCLENCECGLQIIGTERHEARRIDRQLRGRAGRQGDPGASQFFISLEDDLMRLFGSDRLAGLLEWLGMKEGDEIQHKKLNSYIERAQQKIESINFERRKHTLEYDDVMNKQRESIYGLRRDILFRDDTEELRNIFLNITGEAIEVEFQQKYGDIEKDASEWDMKGFLQWIGYNVPGIDLTDISYDETSKFDPIMEQIMGKIKMAYERRAEAFGIEMIRDVTRGLALRIIDTDWQDHLLAIDELREGIHLRAYGQRDPKIEYQREATELFYEMTHNIRKEIFHHFFHVQITVRESGDRRSMTYRKEEVGAFSPHERKKAQESAAVGERERPEGPPPKQQPFRRQGKKIGPNEPCPCGSGKKYKKCCGRNL
ncbi:SEC-C domain-containing protein, partial [Candidatus Sumerlaeota bacterium]|nr:SEC-C domain-containing protein [Candidatus Sumerlaeota bacterium]